MQQQQPQQQQQQQQQKPPPGGRGRSRKAPMDPARVRALMDVQEMTALQKWRLLTMSREERVATADVYTALVQSIRHEYDDNRVEDMDEVVLLKLHSCVVYGSSGMAASAILTFTSFLTKQRRQRVAMLSGSLLCGFAALAMGFNVSTALPLTFARLQTPMGARLRGVFKQSAPTSTILEDFGLLSDPSAPYSSFRHAGFASDGGAGGGDFVNLAPSAPDGSSGRADRRGGGGGSDGRGDARDGHRAHRSEPPVVVRARQHASTQGVGGASKSADDGALPNEYYVDAEDGRARTARKHSSGDDEAPAVFFVDNPEEADIFQADDSGGGDGPNDQPGRQRQQQPQPDPWWLPQDGPPFAGPEGSGGGGDSTGSGYASYFANGDRRGAGYSGPIDDLAEHSARQLRDWRYRRNDERQRHASAPTEQRPPAWWTNEDVAANGGSNFVDRLDEPADASVDAHNNKRGRGSGQFRTWEDVRREAARGR